MADHSETAPRLQVVIYRDHDKWWWMLDGHARLIAGPWVRIESAVTNLEEVLGVKAEWTYRNQRVRELAVTGRPMDVEVRR